MKRKKPLRKVGKKTPIGKLEEKADRALQDFYRTLNLKCFTCGRKQDVMHHFIPKSLSYGLRYEPLNLISICNGCHFKHHRTNDPIVHQIILSKMGKEWADELNKLRIERKGQRPEREDLERIIRIYTKNEMA